MCFAKTTKESGDQKNEKVERGKLANRNKTAKELINFYFRFITRSHLIYLIHDCRCVSCSQNNHDVMHDVTEEQRHCTFRHQPDQDLPCSQLTHVTKKFRANGLWRAKDLARTSILRSFRIEKQELASL